VVLVKGNTDIKNKI